jgi:glycosyltransferase involved in cell wall biosynthesis
MPLPQVSVGIPTYNRPDGVLRTLKNIAAQSYKNLDILVSNNNSTNPLVVPLLNECARRDGRIRVIHQKENIGISENFIYVLRNTKADFFMWAADDDEWHPDFISVCMDNLLKLSVGTVMTGFFRHNRALGLKGKALLPPMDGNNRFTDASAFFSSMPHSIFYGIHRRSTIEWFTKEVPEEVDDEYFLLRQILYHGIKTIPEVHLYTAGIEDATYKIKMPPAAPDRYFFQCQRLLRMAKMVLEAPLLSDTERVNVLQKIVLSKLRFILSFETEMRDPTQLDLTRQIFSFLSAIELKNLDHYTRLISEFNSKSISQKY